MIAGADAAFDDGCNEIRGRVTLPLPASDEAIQACGGPERCSRAEGGRLGSTWNGDGCRQCNAAMVRWVSAASSNLKRLGS